MRHPAPPFDPWLWLQACNETWAAGWSRATAMRLREQRLLPHAIDPRLEIRGARPAERLPDLLRRRQ